MAQATGSGLLKIQARPKAISGQRSGPAFFGLAWPGLWPQAGAGTSLVRIEILGNVWFIYIIRKM